MRIAIPSHFLTNMGLALSCSLLFFALGYAALWCFDSDNFPISSVKLVGDKKYLSEKDLAESVMSALGPGFFRLKVSTLQQQLLSLPWIKQADVRKVWPAQIVVNFEEHVPAARWGEEGLMSQSGVLFDPTDSNHVFSVLPLLQGPEGKHIQVWQQYLEMKRSLAPLGLHVKSVTLAPRGAWQISLSNGIKVLLGTDDITIRLKRFVYAYEKELSSRVREIAYVDLRYTSGMAIGWKSK